MPLKSGLRKKKKSIKIPSVSSLKKKLDTLVSEYVRRRSADWRGYVKCVTCGVMKIWNQGMQAGHFISRRHNMIRFNLKNIHPQCGGCNGMLRGNNAKYYPWMVENYGLEEISQLYMLSNLEKQFKVPELLAEIEKYRNLLKRL